MFFKDSVERIKKLCLVHIFEKEVAVRIDNSYTQSKFLNIDLLSWNLLRGTGEDGRRVAVETTESHVCTPAKPVSAKLMATEPLGLMLCSWV